LHKGTSPSKSLLKFDVGLQAAELLDSFNRDGSVAEKKKNAVVRDVTMESVAKLQIRLAPMLASISQFKGNVTCFFFSSCSFFFCSPQIGWVKTLG
jgi:hypothetical protein